MHPLFTRHKIRILAIALPCLMVGGWLLYVYREKLDVEALIEFSEDLPAVLILAAFLILPLFGFSFRLMLILVGVRFGFGWGSLVAGLGILFHNVAAYAVTQGTFRDPVRNSLEKSGHAIPAILEKHYIWFTAIVAAVPGPPYFAKLYLLALTDVPVHIYVGVGAPVYLLFSLMHLGIGSAATDIDLKWVILLTAAFLLTLLFGFWLKKHPSMVKMLEHKKTDCG
ncbi:MAG: hypothetical protein JJU29_07870 [Verrucomicrobia bacterium]|nr:hypothetical protein [Verrucomicrobiota bacterium]MCH8511957.1 VTT domain-containing protein [Kiritimatiellia bacterium]